MIENLRKWCENLIVAVAISIIIEMLLPEGNNKKYIKVIIGIYIIYITINPIFNIINYNFDFSTILPDNTVQTSSSTNEYEKNMVEVYVDGIKNSIKTDIIELGYDVGKINIKLDNDYSEIVLVEIEIIDKTNGITKIDPINIGESPQKNNVEYDDIIRFLEENYSVKKENISIFQRRIK